jgi:hypothetical protein
MIDMAMLGESADAPRPRATASRRSGTQRPQSLRDRARGRHSQGRLAPHLEPVNAARVLARRCGSSLRPAWPRMRTCCCSSAPAATTTRWLQTEIAHFFEELVCELPAALERVLGNQMLEVKPRWAKGTALRLARLLAEHIDELERKNALLGDIYGITAPGGRHD